MEFVGKIALVTALAGVGGTGLGGLVSCLFRRDSSRTVSLLLSFAAGVMISVVCFDLLSDAVTSGSGREHVSVFIIAAGVMLGYAVIAALNAWISRSHPAPRRSDRKIVRTRDREKEDGAPYRRSGLFIAGLVMAVAIALHNVPEGMVIGASFAASAEKEILNRVGIVTAIVIGLHNIPEGMAVAVPLISGGMSRPRAVRMTALTGVPTVLGALLGFLLGTMGPLALALSLSFASGAMLYMVFGELLPEAVLMWRSKLPALAAVIGMMTGLIIIYG